MAKVSFIHEIGVIIKCFALAYGYKYPSAIIAMAILESNYGASLLSSKYHNYFGMKCGSSWKGGSVNLATKEEYTAGTLTPIRDNFRTYPDIFSGCLGHFDFLKYSRYSNLKDATSPRDYLEKIVKDGYCTSKSYVNSCMAIIDKWNLTEFDK